MCGQVRSGLGHIDPYFTKLGDAMVTWIEAWRMLNPPAGSLKSESSPADESAAKPKGSEGVIGKLANGLSGK